MPALTRQSPFEGKRGRLTRAAVRPISPRIRIAPGRNRIGHANGGPIVCSDRWRRDRSDRLPRASVSSGLRGGHCRASIGWGQHGRAGVPASMPAGSVPLRFGREGRRYQPHSDKCRNSEPGCCHDRSSRYLSPSYKSFFSRTVSIHERLTTPCTLDMHESAGNCAINAAADGRPFCCGAPSRLQSNSSAL